MTHHHVAPLWLRLLLIAMSLPAAAVAVGCLYLTATSQHMEPGLGVVIPAVAGAVINLVRRGLTGVRRTPYWLGVSWVLAIVLGGLAGLFSSVA